MKIQRLAVLSALVLFAGCAVRSETSSGSVHLDAPLSKCTVSFSSTLPSQIEIHKSSHGSQITYADKQRAVEDTRAQVTLFQKEFKARFFEKAKSLGITEGQAGSPDVDALVLRFDSLTFMCSESNCIPRTGLSTKVLDAHGAALWTYSSSVGPNTVYSSINPSLVDSYIDSLLAQMKTDHLVSR
jgi:hypothetical protein